MHVYDTTQSCPVRQTAHLTQGLLIPLNIYLRLARRGIFQVVHTRKMLIADRAVEKFILLVRISPQ
jgi:hypothetical protein